MIIQIAPRTTFIVLDVQDDHQRPEPHTHSLLVEIPNKQRISLMFFLKEANQVINPKLYEFMESSNRGGGRGGGQFQNRSRWRQTGNGGGYGSAASYGQY